MAKWRFFPLLAAALLTLSLAIDVSQEHQPQGPLGVRIDYQEVTRSDSKDDMDHIIMFSSHLTFKESVDKITDEQLHQIAQDAYQEMKTNYGLYRPSDGKRSLPGALGVLALGNEVFIASTRKGRGSFVEQSAQTPVSMILAQCNTIWNNWDGDYVNAPTTSDPAGDMDAHVHQAKCGEVNLIQQFYQVHPHDTKYDGKIRMATIVPTKSGDSQILPPCGSTELEQKKDGKYTRWGCKLMLVGMEGALGKITYLSVKTKTSKYDLSTLAGGVVTTDQVAACSRPNLLGLPPTVINVRDV